MEFGPEQDLRRIVETYSSMLLHLAMTRTRCTADAEDAVQEVFLSLLTKKPRFRDGEHEKAWLIRATIHRACDIQRAASSRLLPLDEAQEVPAPEPEEAPQLLSAVQALPEKYSTVVHLYYYEGFTIKEIAKLLGLPSPTVGTRLSRGREKLKAMLKEDNYEP